MNPLEEALSKRILLLDGAMGTMIQSLRLSPEDFGGPEREGCNEILVRTRPDAILSIHEAYLRAGADIIETNTFGATRIVLSEYGLENEARSLNKEAALLGRKAAERHSTSDRPRFVAGSIGPTTKALSVTGGVTFPQLVEAYREQAVGLLEGGVDALLVETSQDVLNVKAAGVGIRRAFRDLGIEVPLMISATIEPSGTTLGGSTLEAFVASVEHLEPLLLGINCSLGPDLMRDHVRTLVSVSPTYVGVYPNAGLPDERGLYDETPESFAHGISPFLEMGGVRVVGGCCGTTPEHISALRKIIEDRHPLPFERGRERGLVLAGLERLDVDPNNRPFLVGERTNVVGSRKFRDLVRKEAFDEASEIARKEVRAGALLVDVCLADPDRNEKRDAERFYPIVVRKVRVPLLVDTTDPEVLEVALQRIPGKPVVNSINLEEGEERIQRVLPLVQEYGAAVVFGCIDEDPVQGMATTAERKVAIAQRGYALLTEKYGLRPEDIIFDPLVFPVATGDPAYRTSAKETIEAVRRISELFPRSSTILGISNVSFGLPPKAREVLNSVFLYHCVQAGLTLAIVNPEGLIRLASIPPEPRKIAERILFEGGRDDLIQSLTELFRGTQASPKSSPAPLPLEERLARYVVEGRKDGLVEDLEEALARWTPLEIINGPLMKGMDEVGKLFNENKLIVAEVLQSAEVMKAAVRYLEPKMEKKKGAHRARIILATVKGDVHDIGKNLVQILFSNNSYEVIDLGIKVPPEEIIRACRKHRPDAVGLSGLLVKSAHQMVATAEDLRSEGIDLPLFVGGAALTARFAYTRIAPAYGGPVLYARDAMAGLSLANELFTGDREGLLRRIRAEAESLSLRETPLRPPSLGAKAQVRHDHFPPRKRPDFLRHVLRNADLGTLWSYVNPGMLYSKHLGLRGDVEKLLREKDEKALFLYEEVERLKETILREGWMKAHAVYRFLPASSEGESLILYDPDSAGRILETFTFPRQKSPPGLCLSDFVRPVGEGEPDTIALFVVTAGEGVRERAERLREEGRFLWSHALQALALETAEAFAERLHQRLRNLWGIPDEPGTTLRDLFKKKYAGCRYSFGYPACPDLKDQEKLFRILDPSEIGVRLTEGYMMDPEASVSALVLHHPDANYFSVD